MGSLAPVESFHDPWLWCHGRGTVLAKPTEATLVGIDDIEQPYLESDRGVENPIILSGGNFVEV